MGKTRQKQGKKSFTHTRTHEGGGAAHRQTRSTGRGQGRGKSLQSPQPETVTQSRVNFREIRGRGVCLMENQAVPAHPDFTKNMGVGIKK